MNIQVVTECENKLIEFKKQLEHPRLTKYDAEVYVLCIKAYKKLIRRVGGDVKPMRYSIKN